MTDRQAARTAGVLFIGATVPFSISVAVLAPVLDSPDFLALAASNPGRVSAGVLLELVNHVAVVGIAVVLYPVLRRTSERLAVGYLAARSIEAALFAMATANLLGLSRLGRVVGSGLDASGSGIDALSVAFLAGHDWNQVTLPFIAFAFGALMLNYVLFRDRLVPRWISGWGLLAAASILSARLLLIGGISLGSAAVTAFDAPIFAQEMVFAGWLIVRGLSARSASEKAVPGGTL